MTTPRGSPELVSAQATPETTVNEQIRRTEAGAHRFVVADRVTAPPGSCADGAVYLIIATATGAFAGKEGQLATAVGANAASGWYYRSLGSLGEGALAYVQDEDVDYRWNGSAWATLGATATEATAAEGWTGTSTGKYLSPKIAQDMMAPTALTSGATITPDFNAGANFTLTLAHNATLANPSNLQAGDSGAIEITQDGTGSRTLAYGSQWKFPSGAPVLSTAAGAVDLLTYWAPTTGRILTTLTKAYSS